VDYGCRPRLLGQLPVPTSNQFLDFIAAGPLTRPECGAGGESTPSGATGARESVHYVFRRSSWTPLLARLGGLLVAFLAMSTQLSAYIDSWILSLVFGNLLFVYGAASGNRQRRQDREIVALIPLFLLSLFFVYF
jgi:hypothetical protein